MLKIETVITPNSIEQDTQFDNSIVVLIDVLRSGTSICAALSSDCKEIIPCETTDKAVQLYNSLSKESRFLGGERGGLRPSGFDAGNSPIEYKVDNIKNRTVIISTTNGTKIFLMARRAAVRLVGVFSNLSVTIEYLKNLIEKNISDRIFFICAGNQGRFSYEDTLCAGAFINSILNSFQDISMSDSSHAVKNLYNLHHSDFKEFLSHCEHAAILRSLGFEKDIETALTVDLFPVVATIQGNVIKKHTEI